MLSNNMDKAPRGSISQIILKALSSGNKYGYEICKDIEKLTNGRLVLKQPSLYSSLRRMEEQGLISSYWKDSELGGKRHYYSLTESGKEIVDKEDFISDEELISSLPAKEGSNKSNLVHDEQPTTSVLKQENLFDLSSNKSSSPTKQEDEPAKQEKSFFQFDLFNQNVSFVKKEGSISKDNIKTFVNKYSNLDNHSQEIEPETSLNISPSPLDLKLDLNKEVKITRENIINQEEVADTNTNISSSSTLNEENNLITRENISDQKISWDENSIEPLDENKNDDYKSVIGQLYNNSRLLDPYEQNKYQNFKELFPKTNVNENETLSAKKIQFEENQSQEKIKSLIKSSKESNIDCEDIRNLNNLYNLQGIEIKLHDKKENTNNEIVYTDKNKLNMVRAWILSFFMFIELLFSYVILKSNNFILPKQRIVFYLFLAFILTYLLIATSENLLDRYRLVVVKSNFKKSIIYRLFVLLILIIIVFTLNISFGMTNLFQVDFFVYWFIPILMSLNIIFSSIIYEFLLKSKKFDN